MKKNSFIRILIWFIGFLPIIITIIIYPVLPQSIPIHWGINGNIDAYAPRSSAFLTATCALLCAFIYEFLPHFDPKRKSYDKFKGAYSATCLSLCFFMLIMHCLTIYAAFYPTALNIPKSITIFLGMLMCIVGNFMPKFRHNYFCGIRTPWTLANEDCWHRTHRFGALIMIIGGITTMIFGILLNFKWLYIAILCTEAVVAAVVTIYSYIAYKQIQKSVNKSSEKPVDN